MLVEGGVEAEECDPHVRHERAGTIFCEFIIAPIQKILADLMSAEVDEDFRFEDFLARYIQFLDVGQELDPTTFLFLNWLESRAGYGYFITGNGRVGMCREDIQVDIYLIVGSVYPDILPPAGTEGALTWLGHAHLHGVGYREINALGLPSPGPRTCVMGRNAKRMFLDVKGKREVLSAAITYLTYLV